MTADMYLEDSFGPFTANLIPSFFAPSDFHITATDLSLNGQRKDIAPLVHSQTLNALMHCVPQPTEVLCVNDGEYTVHLENQEMMVKPTR